MKRFPFLIIAVLLLSILSACQPRTEIKYLETSVTQEYIGTVTFRSELEYDENGVQTAFIQYTDGEEISRVEYTHTDNEIIGIVAQDSQTNFTDQKQTGVTRQKYEKDAAGNILRLEMYVDDVLYSITENTYDNHGNILTCTQHTVASGNTYTSTYTYDSSGNCIRVNYDYGDGIGSVVENTFDEEGILISSTNFDLEGNITRREEHTLGDDGVEIIRIVEPNTNTVSIRYDTKDEHGNLILSETYDEKGELMVRITRTYQKFEIPIN